MKKIITFLFLCCGSLLAFSQDQEEIQHSKHLRSIKNNDYERGAKFKHDSIYRTDQNSVTAIPFLSKKDYFTYNKDAKVLTQTTLSSKDGTTFLPSLKNGINYNPNGTVKIDSTLSYNTTSKAWENSYKYTNLTYDTNGFATSIIEEDWDNATKQYYISTKYEYKNNKAGELIQRKTFDYDLTKKVYKLRSLDSTLVLDAQGNSKERISYTITWNGNTPSYEPIYLDKLKSNANGNATEIASYDIDVVTKQWVVTDSIFYSYNAKNIYSGSQFFAKDDVTQQWYLDYKSVYQIDPATDLYTSQKFERWSTAQNVFYDWRVRKYFASMLTSTSDYTLQQSFEISPNPTLSDLNLAINMEETNTIQVNVLNNLGQVLSANEYKGIKTEKIAIPTQSLEAGIYFLQIKIGEKQATKRFVKN